MKKINKMALAAVLTLTAAGSMIFAGCGENASAKEDLGTYHYNRSEYAVITQGSLIRSYSETVTIYSDYTFSATFVFDCYYSSDGESFNPTAYKANTVYGVYEISYEDADLGEKGIKITDVTRVVTDGADVQKADFTSDLTDVINDSVLGKEITLASDYKSSESISNYSVNNALNKKE